MESVDFYTTSAQVIPVFFLAAALEQRLFDIRLAPREAPRRWAVAVIGLLVLAAVAEWLAILGAQHEGSVFPGHSFIVWAGIGSTMTMAMLPLLLPWIAVLRGSSGN